MNKSLDSLERLIMRARASMIMKIMSQVQNESFFPKNLFVIDPKSPIDDWVLARVKVVKVGSSGKCQCNLADGENVTYDLEEFDTDSMCVLVGLLESERSC